MTALAGFWAIRALFDPLDRCGSMLDAQSEYGSARGRCARFADLALGSSPYLLHPSEASDGGPLVSGSGRYLLVADLRLDVPDELAGARPTAGIADAQLLLESIERDGIEAIDRLLGDFALACFDRERGRLHLARDALGQRPLFWHRGAGFIAFASMPKGLHAIPEVPRAPDLEAVARHVALLSPRPDQSFFAGTSRVPPGHIVTLTPDGADARRYWTPRRTLLRLPRFEDYVERYRAELDAAVARRLRGAGAVVASHLSGGWDSSAVTATAARLLDPGARLIAFTSVPAGGAASPAPTSRFADEAALAAATARLYPATEHVTVQGTGASPLACLDRQVELFERPLFNLCNHVWLEAIRSAARERGARVLLTGEIGNWTISAAPGSLLADLLREGRLLAWAREAAAAARQGRGRLRGIAASSFGPWIPEALWRRFVRFGRTAPVGERTVLHPAWRDRLEREHEGLRLGQARPPADYFADAATALCEMDFGEYRKGILGGWGIDKRDATADRRLIEFCFSLPLEMLTKDGVRRPLARAALADRLPQAVLDERRKGYQAADWHVGLTADRERIAELIERIAADPGASSVLDVPALRSLLRDWPTGGWERPDTIARYRIALLQGLGAGHFVLAASRRAGRPEPGRNDPRAGGAA